METHKWLLLIEDQGSRHQLQGIVEIEAQSHHSEAMNFWSQKIKLGH